MPLSSTTEVFLFRLLFRTENTVARITETRQNIAVLVEAIIHVGAIDIHVGMGLGEGLNSFGSGDHTHELDLLAAEALKIDGVLGSRMTGAGFGGCTVSIVKDEAIDAFIEQVGKAYAAKIGYAADFYVVEIGEGPCEL